MKTLKSIKVFKKYMKKLHTSLFAILLATGLNAGFMDDMASQVGGMLSGATGANSSTGAKTSQTAQTLQLVSQLSQALNITPQQAAGGTAALMATASQSMPKDSYNSLLSSVPGLSSILGNSSPVAGLLGSAGASGTDKVFKALGMDSSTVSKFAPALLEIFKQYTDSNTINQLSKAWAPLTSGAKK